MYAAHELNVTPWIKRGSRNVLAVKVTPERLIQDVDGVELADSWYDWINWKYIGYKGRKRGIPGPAFPLFRIAMPASGNPFICG
jgi:exo-1,4-beta-D-glucosaminidase